MLAMILLPALAIIVGIAGLVWSADRFVNGSAALARDLGISPLVIGLTVVSIGTSAPEVLVAINAALRDSTDLAVGNALGSNLANIGLVLGITLLIAPVPVRRSLLMQDIPILLAVTGFAGIALWNDFLGAAESWLLLAALVVFIVFSIRYKKCHHAPEEEEPEIPAYGLGKALFLTLTGLLLLIAFSDVLVWGAKQTAQAVGISDLVIGLTVVAVGTSLPELAASVTSALKGHSEIAIGNVIGSNIFNLLAVLPAAGIINPSVLPAETFARDFVCMTAITVLFGILLWVSFSRAPEANKLRIPRVMGLLFLIPYIGYYFLLA